NPRFNDNLFRHRHKLQRLFGDWLSDRYCRYIRYNFSGSFTGHHLCRRIEHTYSDWRNFLSVEYGTDNSQHYGKPDINNNIFGHRNKFGWLLRNCISDGFCRFIHYSFCNGFTGHHLCRRIEHTYSDWRNFLSVEYGTDNGKHYRKSGFDDYLFCYWNEWKWMFGDRFSYSFGRFVYYSFSDSISSNNLYRRFKYTHGYWCNQLPMEHRTDDSKHYGQSNNNLYLYCNRYECKRMLRYGVSNRFGWRIFECCCYRITFIHMFRRIKQTYGDGGN